VLVGTAGLQDLYSGLSGPATFGTGGNTAATSAPGNFLGIENFGLWLAVANGFASGSSISSSAFFAGATIASLGMDPGTYTWSWSNDFVSLVVPGANAEVPLPAALPLFGTGLALMGFVGSRRKRKAKLAA
jgi:hypothetical protein